jgi:hypothetical protein
MRRQASWITTIILLVGISVAGYARMGTSDARLIPYSGTLRSGGVAANGIYEMRFGLFPTLNPGDEPACLDTDPTTCVPWGEEQTVTVSAGNFAVKLGESTAIVDSDISSNAMYLAMAIKGPADLDFVHVGNHEIIPVPWAARAATSTNYEVTGNLTVAGSATVSSGATLSGGVDVNGGLDVNSGNLRVLSGSASTSGNLDVGGHVASENGFLGDVGHGNTWAGFAHADAPGVYAGNATGQDNYAVLQNNAGTETLVNTGPAGNIRLRVGNADRYLMNAAGNMSLVNGATISGKTTGQCDCYTQGIGNASSSGADLWAYCADGYFVQGINSESSCGSGTDICLYQFRCCRPCAMSAQ